MDEQTRREVWLKKRIGKITSSELDKFMGKGKKGEFSDPCIKYLYKIKHQRRTGKAPEEKTCFNFEWGHANECLAINWLREILSKDVRDCNADYEDIVFHEPFPGFGDSPDAEIYSEPWKIEGVVEIKSPADESVLEELWECKSIRDTNYFAQILGHFIGNPQVSYAILVIWDGYETTGKILKIERSECEQEIEYLTEKIKKASELIDACLLSDAKLKLLLTM